MADYWLTDSLHRIYPRSAPEAGRALRLDLLRGERGSFQIACRTGSEPAMISAHVDGPDGISVQVRRVGYVPLAHIDTDIPADAIEGLDHLPGLAPDPLFPETMAAAGPFETNSFWVSLHVDGDCPAG